MLPVAGRGRRGLCYRVRGKAVAKQLTTEFYTVVLPLTFVLIIISIPLPPHSFIQGLKPGLHLTGGEVEPPAKISDPPAAIKKHKGVDFKH